MTASQYLHALEDGEVPLEFLFSGTVFYAGAGGRLQVGRIAWDKEAEYRLPVAVWREMMDRYFPDSAWLRLRRESSTGCAAYKARHALLTLGGDGRLAARARRARSAVDPVRAIADAVLYEGYVLWPYRRSALKNRQRWTFGGVYPRGHSEGRDDDPWTMRDPVPARGRRTRARRRGALPACRPAAGADATASRWTSEVDGEHHLSWEEATEREVGPGAGRGSAAGDAARGAARRGVRDRPHVAARSRARRGGRRAAATARRRSRVRI